MKIGLQLALLCGICMMLGCKSKSACGETTLQNVSNPQSDRGGNKLKAEVVQINCGATSDFTTEVRLLREDGEALGSDNGAVFATYHGTPKLSIHWSDENTLQVDCADCKAEDTTLKITKRNFTVIKYSFDYGAR